jgi:hypothetical protein
MWVKLDDKFWSDPDVLTVGNEAAGVFARMLSYCGSHETDGHIGADIARFISASRKRPIDALVEAGLIVINGDGFNVPRFLEFNPSATQWAEMSEKKSAAGKLGALAKAKARARADGKAGA